MPTKSCPNCHGTNLITDQNAGHVICGDCGVIVEETIFVSEVGFAEAPGGRVHVQGAFVSNHATGISGFRGRGSAQSTENIKTAGQGKIAAVSEAMGLNNMTRVGAQRLFALAVDNGFNRGRRTDYIVASCLYLQSRLKKEPHMLIDFSERLAINVFELGGTYLKLRTILCLPDPMPLTDPAIYNLRFANRLHLGNFNNVIAADASRLVRRFQADWMSEGRRPAGVCGACLVIASRMNGFLRTPEEVAQVVKVSAVTVKRRLVEFARTSMAHKTISQWKAMTDEELHQPEETLPPVTKAILAREEKQRLLKAKKEEEESGAIGEGDDDEDEVTAPALGRKKRKREQNENEDGDDALQVVAPQDADGALAAAVEDLGEEDIAEVDAAEGEGEEQDPDLDHPEPDKYAQDLDAAGDDPEAAQKKRAKDVAQFRRLNRAAAAAEQGVELDDDDELSELQEVEEQEEEEEEEEEDVPMEEEEDENDQEEAAEGKEDEALQEVNGKEEGFAKEEGLDRPGGPSRVKPKFNAWDDPDALVQHLETKYLYKEKENTRLPEAHMRQRVNLWLRGRDPRVIVQELEVVNRALRARDKGAKAPPESDFPDIDDDELDIYWTMEQGEKMTRARMWLSRNGKWLDEEKEKQEKREALERSQAHLPVKTKPRKKRKAPHQGPYNTPREAMDSISRMKHFSNRVNMDVMRAMGLDAGLQSFPEEKDDEKADEGGDKEENFRHGSAGRYGYDEDEYGDDE